MRTSKDAASAAALERLAGVLVSGHAGLADARAAAAQLRTDFKAIDVVESPELGSPEVVSVKPGSGFLTPAADRVEHGRSSRYSAAYGVSQARVASLNWSRIT